MIKVIFLLFISLSLFAEEDESLYQSLTSFKRELREFVIRPADGTVICKEYGKRFLRNATQRRDITDCITRDNTKAFRADDGRCVLVTTQTKVPMFLTAIDQHLCDEDTPYHWTTSPERNIYQHSLERFNTVCSNLDLCLATLKENDHYVLSSIASILEHVDVKSQLKDLKVKAEKGSVDTPFALNIGLSSMRRALRSCSRGTYSSADKEIEAMLSLQRDLSSITSTLENDTTVYHWFDTVLPWQGFDGKFEEKSFAAREYARGLQNNFFSWDIEGGTGFQGRGLYASRSLTATKNYGNNVLKITLPKGSRFLDLEANSQSGNLIPLEEETINLLTKAGCNLKIQQAFSFPQDGIFMVQKADFSSDSTCRRYFNKVVKTLDLKFLTYDYNQVSTSICKNDSDAAFVIIDIDFNSDNTSSYTEPIDYNQYNSEEIPDSVPASLRDDFAIASSKHFDNLPAEEKQRIIQERSSTIYQCEED